MKICNLTFMVDIGQEVDGLVLELDAAYSASSIDSSDQVDRSQELTYVVIDILFSKLHPGSQRFKPGRKLRSDRRELSAR